MSKLKPEKSIVFLMFSLSFGSILLSNYFSVRCPFVFNSIINMFIEATIVVFASYLIFLSVQLTYSFLAL